MRRTRLALRLMDGLLHKLRSALNLFKNPFDPKSVNESASSKPSAPQRTGLSAAEKLLDNAPNAPLTDPIRSSQPVGSKLTKEDGILAPSPMLMPMPMPMAMATTQTSTAIALGLEGTTFSLASQTQPSQPPTPTLAVQAVSVTLSLQDALENEAQNMQQDLSQPESKLPTKQQHPWLNQIWSFSKLKPQWPEPEASIGRSFQPLGFNKCWEVKGPARELSDRILPEIRTILARCGEDLNARESVPLLVLLCMYMTGKDERTAAPTVLFSCQSRTLRRKAMKIVKKSNLFQTLELEGVLLAESAKPPMSLASDDERSYLSSMETEQTTNIYIVPPQSMDNLCGISIFIQHETQPLTFTRVATMGGILQQGDNYHGLTVAHSFLRAEGAQLSSEDSFEFSYDDSDDSEGSPNSYHPPLASPHLELCEAKDVVGLGHAKTSSFNNELDYALIDIELQSFKAPNEISFDINGEVQHRYPQDISELPTKDCQILARTGSKGIIRGEMSGVLYFAKMPFGKIFQEVRLIRLESAIGRFRLGSPS